MIENTAPAEVVVTDIVVGYTKVAIVNNLGIDTDIAGRVVNLDGTYHSTYSGDAPYTLVSGLTHDTTYSISIGRFDSMNNSALVESGFGINFTTPVDITLREYPNIVSNTVTGEFVEVGSSPPLLNLTLTGYADSIQVEYSEVGANIWTTGWSGPFSTDVSIPGLPVGTYDIRVRGVVNLPTHPYVEYSGWLGISSVELINQFSAPSAPTDITFSVSKVQNPADRYDVAVSWDWDRSTGPDIRSFVLERLNTTEFGIDWSKAEKINTAGSTTYVVIDHLYNYNFLYRVTAYSWGASGGNSTVSAEAAIRITESTVLETDLTQKSRIAITNSHIKAYKASFSVGGPVYSQVFFLDAFTGNMAIGELDGNGEAPITVTAGNVNVDGTIITNKIVAASFVLANTNGASNPALYSAAKPNYGDASNGIYMGHDDTNKFKFDLGNNSKYIRWDGDDLRISGNVLIGSSTDTLTTLGNVPTTAYIELVLAENMPPTTDAGKTADYISAIGKSPLLGSVIVYRRSNPLHGISQHFSYDGSNWVVFNVVVDGNLLATGTVVADSLVADSISGNELRATAVLNVGSGDENTTISGIGDYRLWAGNTDPLLAPFRVTKEGSLELNSTETSSSIVIKNNAIQVLDALGNVRVQIGDLSVPGPLG